MRRLLLTGSVLLAAAVGAACTPPPPVVRAVNPPAVQTSAAEPGLVMAGDRYSAAEMGAWFASKRISGSKLSTTEVAQLAQIFIEEGRAEGVTGDIAFIQAILETGWFRFSERMPVEHHNFSGIGAVDSGTTSAVFTSRREGVRAQIQHLRAYADPTVTIATLHNPNVDPRFHLVSPKGRAPSWSQYGNGNWATDPDYAGKIERLHAELRAFALARR